jgi:hypothetical protein
MQVAEAMNADEIGTKTPHSNILTLDKLLQLLYSDHADGYMKATYPSKFVPRQGSRFRVPGHSCRKAGGVGRAVRSREPRQQIGPIA